MSIEERVAQLEAENAVLREQIKQLLGYVAENAALREQIKQLLGYVAELEGRLAKDSHNSSKPPANDSLAKKTRSQLSGAVDADFFVTGIVPDFTRVCYAFGPCFLSPFVHLVLILKEPVTAKDVTACERGRRDFY